MVSFYLTSFSHMRVIFHYFGFNHQFFLVVLGSIACFFFSFLICLLDFYIILGSPGCFFLIILDPIAIRFHHFSFTCQFTYHLGFNSFFFYHFGFNWLFLFIILVQLLFFFSSFQVQLLVFIILGPIAIFFSRYIGFNYYVHLSFWVQLVVLSLKVKLFVFSLLSQLIACFLLFYVQLTVFFILSDPIGFFNLNLLILSCYLGLKIENFCYLYGF